VIILYLPFDPRLISVTGGSESGNGISAFNLLWIDKYEEEEL
jgi:hypothetical protein